MVTVTADQASVFHVIARTNVGGPALIISSLMRLIPTEAYSQVLLRGTCSDGEMDYFDFTDVPIDSVLVPGLGRRVSLLDDARAFLFLFRFFRKHRPSIVDTHTGKAGLIGRLAAFFAGVPIRIHTFHGHVFAGYFGPFVSKLLVLLERVLSLVTTHIVAVGDQTHEDLRNLGISRPGRSSAIAPGTTEGREMAASSARETLGLPRDSSVVSFIGRLTQIKRPERFLQLAASIGSSHPSVRFLVAGDGDMMADLTSMATPNVSFIGMTSDITLVLRASDIVVMTSDNEGLPLALIEAAMHGVPAVTTDAGSVRQIVEHSETGLVVPIGDSDALLGAVIALLDDPERRAVLGANAQRHARTYFGEARLVDDYRRLYDNLLAARR
jgi:glycosyltransferase involved in cell wall biosynthesis